VSKPSKRGLVTLLLIVVTLGMGGWAFLDTFSNVGYAPQQPVPFSHKLHAGTRKIPCLYCHANAERSRHATIPSTNVCMNCHLVVRTDRPAIQTVAKLYEEGKTIPWVRVHRVPDYVYFSHRWHVARGVACQTCHGQVQNMDVIRQAENLKMGWCISCHRQNKASQECNTCHM
jgi:cytochrome c7-like protein